MKFNEIDTKGHGKPILYVALGYIITQVSENFGYDLQPVIHIILQSMGLGV